jgi:hypothetical protein
MTEKVKEVQDYLETQGIIVAETTIVDTAIYLVRRNELGAFVRELEKERRKE